MAGETEENWASGSFTIAGERQTAAAEGDSLSGSLFWASPGSRNSAKATIQA